MFAYSNIHNLLVFREVGIVDFSLQLFPVSSKKPPTPLKCVVCALVFNLNKAIITAWTPGCQLWNPGLICSESIKPSSALEDLSLSFFNQVILIFPYLIFIIMLVLLLQWKLSTCWFCFFLVKRNICMNTQSGLIFFHAVLVNHAIMPFQEWMKSQEEDHFSSLLDVTVYVDLLYESLKVIKA